MEELREFIVFPRVPGLPVPVPSTSGSTVPGVPVTPFVSAPVPSTSSMLHTPMSSSECKWSVQMTKMLIDLYEKYRPKVGGFKIRNVKQMWVVIAQVLSEDLQMNISPNHCENRWRVHERNYKKYVDNKNATGRGRKYFDYAEEMDRIFAEKKTVNPAIVLNSDTVHMPTTMDEEDAELLQEEKNSEQQEAAKVNVGLPVMKKKTAMKRKSGVLEKMRQDRLRYQEKRLEIELARLEETKRKNDRVIQIMEERNIILREKECHLCTHHSA